MLIWQTSNDSRIDEKKVQVVNCAPSPYWRIGLLGLLASSLGQAQGFKGTLQLEQQHAKQSVLSQSAQNRPPDHPRPILHLKQGDFVTARWTFSSDTARPIEDVLIHFFVAEEGELGQEQVPDLKPARVVIESALTMDFQGTNSASGTFTFQADKPGIYMVRVDAQDPKSGQLESPSAALDLEVK